MHSARALRPDRDVAVIAAELRQGALAGLLATVGMDVAARGVVAPALRLKPPGVENLGRWVGHMREGQFVHDDIRAAPPVPHEIAIGVAVHYLIGATLGAGYSLLFRARRRPLPLALGYGLATTAFPWFIAFPACGQGRLGRRTGSRLAAFSLLNHLVFGLGLGAASSRFAKHSEVGP